MQGFGNDLYIGDWVPQARAQGIMDAGVDPEIYEMQQLNDYALAHPEARGDTMKRYYDAMDRWGMKGKQYESEARQLTEQAMRNNANKLYNENPGPGSGGFGLAQQIAGAVLSGQAESILGARLGRIMLPAGNALETLNGMGLPYSDGLKRYAASSDWLNQFSYNPDNVFDPKNFGFGYKSDGIGGNDFGPVGYGGDGHQFAQEGFQEYNRNANNAANQRRWGTAMANATPGGRYQGASREYTANIPSWNNFPKNYGGPGATNGQFGDGSRPTSTEGQEYQLGDKGYVRNTAGAGNQGEWDFGTRYNPPNPRPFDPTDPRSGYKPELGTQDAFLKSHGKSAYLPPDSLRNYGKYDSQSSAPNQPQVGNTMVGSVEDQEMYGGYNEGALQPMAAFAKAPKLVRQSGPKPFGGSLSSDWQSYDLGTGELFGPGYQTARGGSNGSSSFDHFATNPLDVAPIAMGQRPGAFVRALGHHPSVPFGR